MLDIQLLRSNLAAVAERLATRGVTLDTAAFEVVTLENTMRLQLELDKQTAAVVEGLRAKYGDPFADIAAIAAVQKIAQS